MKHAAQTAGFDVRARLRNLTQENRPWIAAGIYGLISGILANSIVFKTVAPFGAAFCAAVPREFELIAAAGAILGSVLSSNPGSGMKYIAAVLIIVGVRYLARSLGKPAQSLGARVAVSFLSVFSMSITLTALGGMDPYYVVMSIGESIMAAGATYFFGRSLAGLQSLREVRHLPAQAMPCLLVSFAIFIMALSEWEIGSLSLGRMLAIVVILLCAVRGKESAGAVAGVTAGAAMSLVSGKFGFLMGSYGFGGMMAGVFSVFGKLGSAVVFILINALSAVLFGKEMSSLIPILETACATVVFLLIPMGWLNRIQEAPAKAEAVLSPGTPVRRAILSRLGCASDALKDIAGTTQKVADRLGSMEQEPISNVYETAAQRVCRRCGSNVYCWQSKYTDTMNAMNDITELLRQNGTISQADVPGYLQDKCCKLGALVTGINQCYGEYLTRSGTQREISQVRSVVTDQFEGLSLAMDKLSQEISEIHSAPQALQEKLLRLFQKYGLPVQSLECYEDTYSKMTVQATLAKTKTVRFKEGFLTDLEELCDREFDSPQRTDWNGNTRIAFHEKAEFSPEFGASQCCFRSEKLCGDSYEQFLDFHGWMHLILSDGMGTGGRAAVDSSMASSLLARLVQAGFDYDAALKLVNSALLVKSQEESLATLDAVSLDLYTGQAKFYKAGAAPAFVRRTSRHGAQCTRVEAASLPAGILRGVAFEHCSLSLQEDDVVVLVSDGATMSGDEWILSELELYGSLSAQEIAQKIAASAKMRHIDGHDDDITVLALKLKRND